MVVSVQCWSGVCGVLWQCVKIKGHYFSSTGVKYKCWKKEVERCSGDVNK